MITKEQWSLLGIEETADRKIIKKAYAEKVKLTHPEEDPLGFQLLQKAYHEAIAYASHAAMQTAEEVFNSETLTQDYTVSQQEETYHNFPEVETAKLSRRDHQSYLLQQWTLLCEQELEDTGAWLNILNEQLWNQDPIAIDTIRKIRELEMRKSYNHSGQIAGKIYSFLRIKPSLENDTEEIYARMHQILKRDAPYSPMHFIEWREHAKKLARQMSINVKQKCGPVEWNDWLHKVSLQLDDLELLSMLSDILKDSNLSKQVQDLLIDFFHLDNTTSVIRKELKEAIQHKPASYYHRVFLKVGIALAGLLCVFLMPYIHDQAEQKDDAEKLKSERVEQIQQKLLEEQKNKNLEQIEEMKKYIKEKQ